MLNLNRILANFIGTSIKKIIQKIRFLFLNVIFLYITVFTFLCILLFNYYYNYDLNTQRTLKNEARHISNTLEETFDGANQLLNYFARQISASETNDINRLIQIIGKKDGLEDNVSWINIGWITAQDMYVYDRNTGKIDPPINLSSRPYLKKCKKEPWKFFLSQVVVWAGAGIRKIPGGIGIIDDQGNYRGTLCVGFKLADLKYRVTQKVNMANYDEHNLSYVVLDKDLHIVLQSPNNQKDVADAFYKNEIGSSNVFLNEEGTLFDPIICEDVTYTHYKKTHNFPYWVLMGMSRKKFYLDFIYNLWPFLITTIFVGLVALHFHLSYREKSNDKIIKGEKSQKDFDKRLKQRHTNQLKDIQSYLTNEEISPSFFKNILNQIIESFENDNIYSNLYLEETDIINFVQECKYSFYGRAIFKKIEIIGPAYDVSIPYIKIDRLKIQQVIRSILRFIIGLGGEKIQIKIEISSLNKRGHEFLQIVIYDTGQSCSKEHWNADSSSSVGYREAEEIINQQCRGQFIYQSPYDGKNGKRFTIRLPYVYDISENHSPNVIRFPGGASKNEGYYH